MKKRIANMWVRALRSGKYTQGFNYLKKYGLTSKGEDQIRHCCLGVLCELYNKSMKRSGEKGISEKNRMGISHFGNQDSVLPLKVMKWAGIKDNGGSFDDGRLHGKGRYGCLATMNDNGVSFKKIAQVIERNVENL